MKTLKFLSAAILLFIYSGIATADFVRIECNPKTHYFRFEYLPADAPDWDPSLDKKAFKKQFAIWAKQGFYDVTNLYYECRLPEAIYKLIAKEPPPSGSNAECGGGTQVSLSLFTNDYWPVLDDVLLHDDCHDVPTVHSFEINQRNKQEVTLCVNHNGDAPEICKGLNPNDLPIYQDGLGKYVPDSR